MENKRINFSLLLNRILGLDKVKSKEDVLKIANNLKNFTENKEKTKSEEIIVENINEIYLGKDVNNENIYINLQKEGIHFILLLGETGSGKSVFHNNLYKQLSETHSPDELGFIFMDMTQVDFCLWHPKHLIMPMIKKTEEALDILEKIKDEEKTIIIHIEECDMVYLDREKFERGIDNVINKNKNIILVFSTSRLAYYLDDWKEKYSPCLVIFKTASEEDSVRFLGNNAAFDFKQPGERILAYNNKQIRFLPFSQSETIEDLRDK